MIPYVGSHSTYALFQIAAALAFLGVVSLLLLRRRFPVIHPLALTMIYLFSNVVAAKVLFDLFRTDRSHGLWNHLSIGHIREGGYWGWPIAFLPAVLVYAGLLKPERRGDLLEAVAWALPPTMFFQKIACFMAGCCHGGPSGLPWAVAFPAGSACSLPGPPVHPVQLYDAVSMALLLALLWIVKRRRPGIAGARLFWIFVAGYALSRFVTELFRAEFAGRLLGSQWLESGAFCAAAGILVALGNAKGRRGECPVRPGEASFLRRVPDAGRSGGAGP